MEEKRMGEGYCPRCLRSKANCTCIADSLSFVEALQEGHEKDFAYSNQYIDYIDDEMNELEERLQL